MSDARSRDPGRADTAPGDSRDEGESVGAKVRGYLLGYALAIGLTVVSFLLTGTKMFWLPSLPVALIVLAIAQMGIHLVFFLHLNSSPDSTNNIMALGLGLLIVFLVMAGTLFIMGNLNHNMLPMDQMMRLQR